MPGKMRKLSIYTPEAMRLPIINKKARRMRMPVWLKENHASMSDLGSYITLYLREYNKNHSLDNGPYVHPDDYAT
jgi:hypothetical protein